MIRSRQLFGALFLCLCALAQARDPSIAERYLVVAAHPLAAEAGAKVLGRGGTAVDAAVAVQMVLGLVEPQSSGIGGGAFLLHWSQEEKKLRSYDGRETAPAAAQPGRFLREGKPMAFMDAVVGGRSVGVPGALRMLELAHKRHGALPWRTLFADAIRLAEKGFDAPPRLRAALAEEHFLDDSLFFEDGKPRTRVVNRAYAETLRALAREGADAFYRGAIAAEIVRAVRSHANPGDISEADLAGYRAIEREPVCGPYRGRRVCSMGPPSSGGVALLQILRILERTAFARTPPHSPQAAHLFTEAGRLAFADRARYLGDADFVPVPVARLLSDAYLDARSALIGERSMAEALPGDAERGTSHFSIVDARGDAVAMTSSVESPFGSRIVVRGFVLNNQLTDFDFVPGGANAVAPRKRPRSSMAPTMVFEKGALELVLGSPGGAMIINYVARALVARIDWQLDLRAAIAAPNVGTRNGPTLLERDTPYAALEASLGERGHQVVLTPLVSGLHALERAPGGWRGAADPRRDGAAVGR
ncbi:MAG TPA: gamma-glutamyltransferase [Burkholderiales bacterium]|nr:gamma-glutamyltransferase [Burkholderiales bacterium]